MFFFVEKISDWQATTTSPNKFVVVLIRSLITQTDVDTATPVEVPELFNSSVVASLNYSQLLLPAEASWTTLDLAEKANRRISLVWYDKYRFPLRQIFLSGN